MNRKNSGKIYSVFFQYYPCFVLNPNGKTKNIWNILFFLPMLYTVFIYPFLLAFCDQFEQSWQFYANIAVDLLVLIDVLITSITAYYTENNSLVTDRYEIFKHYARSCMVIDVLGSIPFTLFSDNQLIDSVFKLFRIRKINKFLSLTALITSLKALSHLPIFEQTIAFLSFKQKFLRTSGFFFNIFICVHVASCIWVSVSKLEDRNPSTWLTQSGYIDADIPSIYIAAIYWAISSVMTVGYGDIVAVTIFQRIFACSWMVFGLFFFSFSVGSLSSTLSSYDTKQTLLITKLGLIETLAQEMNLSKELTYKLKSALRYSIETRSTSFATKDDILNELPKDLKYKVAINMHKGSAKHIKLFEEADHQIVSTIIPLLNPGYIEKGQFVYEENELSDEIYFITKGRVTFIKNKIPIVSIQCGGCFGDIEVIKCIKRKFAVSAVRYTEFLIMNRDLIHLSRILFPKFWEEMKRIAYKKDIKYDRSELEIKVIINYKKKYPDQPFINLSTFRNKIEKHLEKRHPQLFANKTREITVEDLWNNIQSLQENMNCILQFIIENN